jgi:hypothetical protein
MGQKTEYVVKFENGKSKTFAVDVDPKTLVIIDDNAVPGPEWTKLDFNKCENCPYSAADKPYCPVAKNLSNVVEFFKDDSSYEALTVFVTSEERTYGKRTDLQTALYSLFGLIMASSSCSHMHLFKTMARFHLPFSSVDETTIRMLGLYLIQEFLKQQQKPEHKIDLKELESGYQRIAVVNRGIIKRLRSIKGGDANKNALIILDNFASLLPQEFSSGLAEVKRIFS